MCLLFCIMTTHATFILEQRGGRSVITTYRAITQKLTQAISDNYDLRTRAINYVERRLWQDGIDPNTTIAQHERTKEDAVELVRGYLAKLLAARCEWLVLFRRLPKSHVLVAIRTHSIRKDISDLRKLTA